MTTKVMRSSEKKDADMKAAAAHSPVVRPARRDDLEQVARLIEAVAAEGRWLGREPAPVGSLDDVVSLMQAEMERALEDATVGRFVAEACGRIVGEIVLELHPYGTADLTMLVDRKWRGRGIGRSLLAAGVEWARASGAQKVALQVWPHNVAARRLYLAAGFDEEGLLRRHYRRRDGEVWDAVLMGLVLESTSPGLNRSSME